MVAGERCELSVALHLARARVALFYSLIESVKLCRVEPRAYLRKATLRAVRNLSTVTLAHDDQRLTFWP